MSSVEVFGGRRGRRKGLYMPAEQVVYHGDNLIDGDGWASIHESRWFSNYRHRAVNGVRGSAIDWNLGIRTAS